MSSLSQLNRNPEGNSSFGQTVWSEVDLARAGDLNAREVLVHRYWYPLYAFLRKQGQRREDAQDIVQGFFKHLFSHPDLGSPDQGIGKFRTFLITRLKSYARDEWRKTQAKKRGAGAAFLSLDELDAEERFRREPAALDDPVKLFERAWARQTMQEARARLRQTWEQKGRAEYFKVLEPMLDGEDTLSYLAIAQSQNTTEGAVKKAAHDLRKSYRRYLLEILQSQSGPLVEGQEAAHLQDFYSALGT